MRELEVKLQFEQAGAQVILDALKAHGYEPEPPVTQLDHVFAARKSDVERPERGTVIARIRIQSGHAFLTVKVRRSADLDRMEYEVEVSDGPAALEILSALGLTEIVRVRKVRWKIVVDSLVTLCIDEVDGLGTYVEIELLEHDVQDRVSDMDERIEWVAQMVGTPYQIIEKGYDRLLVSQVATD